ncbi:MAG: CPBP family glutamic-type intramembrane protease [Thermoguttaceae bacterium]|nr:CPBP family glutamic-type intramembrane protease [Thermoguttaceae bacterium]MDW8039347.1 CPBP family glutamic-type intramembrane protease [Thermoguttaceae bacterium]
MAPTAEQVVLFLLGVVGALVFSVIGTLRLVEQYRQGRDPVPYQPRCPVPWQGWHVVVVMLMFLLAPSLVWWVWEEAGLPRPGAETMQQPPTFSTASAAGSDCPPDVKQPEQELSHQVEQLLRQTNRLDIWLGSVLMTLVVAPVIEEWLFRAVLQGWLEKVERQLVRTIYLVRRRNKVSAFGDSKRAFWSPAAWQPRRWWGAGPVVFSSLLFAGLHFRSAGPPSPRDELLMMLVCQGMGNLLTLVLGSAFLMIVCGARPLDFGLCGRGAMQDLLRGLGAYLLVVGPVYAVLIGAKFSLMLLGAEHIAPDPIPLFVLSLVLGGLYFRRHRLLPCLVLHGAFNATGLLILLLFLSG